MKKVIFTLALLMGATAWMMAQPEVVSGPYLTVDKESHSYGDIALESDGTCEFKVTNAGTEPLIITKCKGTCGCTVPACDTNPIAPGASSVIRVKYDTKRPGPFDKGVLIYSNAVNGAEKKVTINGNVISNASASGAPVKSTSGAPVRE